MKNLPGDRIDSQGAIIPDPNFLGMCLQDGTIIPPETLRQLSDLDIQQIAEEHGPQ